MRLPMRSPAPIAATSAMDAELRAVAAALAALTDAELLALICAANGSLQAAPGFLAWVEHVADWETRRRAGLDFVLQPPDAAIDPCEDAASLAAAMMLRKQFARHVPRVAALFAAIVGALTGTASATRH